MRAVALLDTSILLELLRVPGRSHQAAHIESELASRLQERHALLLPLATVLETGNHIGRLSDGGDRRRYAAKFVELVRLALSGQAPFVPTDDVGVIEVGSWCDEFVEWVLPQRRELTDLSIKKAWEQQCELHSARRVYIWSLDGHLASFDRAPLV